MPEEHKSIPTVTIALVVLVGLLLIVGVFEYAYLRANDKLPSLGALKESVMKQREQEVSTLASGCPISERLVFSAATTDTLLENDIYIACLATGQLFNITNDRNANFTPQLSPDGETVYYYAPRDTNPDFNDWEIWRSDITGENRVRLSDNPLADTFPALSPDGSTLSFTSKNDGVWELHLIDTDGSNERVVSSNGAFNSTFDNSSSTVVFTQNDNQGLQDIFRYNTVSEKLTQLTQTDAQESAPEVSPDGKYITFDSDVNGNFEVYRMDANGENVTQLTQGTANSGTATFSHDGGKLIFVSNRNGTLELFSMGLGGSNQYPILTEFNLFNFRDPAFAARGN